MLSDVMVEIFTKTMRKQRAGGFQTLLFPFWDHAELIYVHLGWHELGKRPGAIAARLDSVLCNHSSDVMCCYLRPN